MSTQGGSSSPPPAVPVDLSALLSHLASRLDTADLTAPEWMSLQRFFLSAAALVDRLTLQQHPRHTQCRTPLSAVSSQASATAAAAAAAAASSSQTTARSEELRF
eukprot:RCo055609